jgi:DTW domain-containing protein YfiP
LEKTELLLKGYEPHDQRLAELQKEETLPVVLWTDHNKNQDSRTYYTIDEVRELETPITLFVMEGTWRNARRMVGKLPHDSRLSLRRDDLFWEGKSLLVPLRRQHGGPKDNLCTAEAVVAALVGLGMPLSSGNTVLAVVAGKIDLIRRYQGKILRES